MKRAGIMLLLLIPACGYSLVQGPPFAAKRVTVVPFSENEPIGLSLPLSRELARLLGAEGVRIVSSADQAQAVLTGTVLSSRTSKNAVTSAGGAIPAYDVRVRIRAVLTRVDGEELWTAHVDLTESFLPAPRTEVGQVRPAVTEANRRRALARLAERAAATLHQQMVLDSAARTERPAPRGER